MTDRPRNAEWTPHLWEGFGLSGWRRMLWRNRFAVDPRCWWVAAVITIVSTIHSICWLLQEAFWRHRIIRAKMPADPIFILGHWRTGTTYLHELLIRDPRHAFPTTCQCMQPNCFLLTEQFMTRFGKFLMPKRRPMDDLATGWDRPQEDEFGLCLTGQPSFYTHCAFPRHRPADFDALDFRGFAEQSVQKWRHALDWFLQRVSFRNPGQRLVLKSPPHTARLPAILKQYPNAKFIYITRDPYRVFSSTVRLWKALAVNHTLQDTRYDNLEGTVLEAGQRLFDAYESARLRIPEGNLVELRYEDLMAEPMQKLANIYRALDLGEFERARAPIHEYILSQRHFKPLASDVPEDVRAKVDLHWKTAVRQFERLTPAKPQAAVVESERAETQPAPAFVGVDVGFVPALRY